MPEPLPPWVADYVGLPWKVLGRDRDGLDCYGLVRLVLAEKFGLVLPALDGGWQNDMTPARLWATEQFVADAVRAICAHHGWQAVDFTDAERAGDVAQLIVHGRPIHIGLVVGRNWFLHVREGTNSAVERLDGMAWRDRLVAVYRHASRSGGATPP